MGISTPSFDEGAPLSLPDDVSNDRDVILDAAAELFDILLDPLALIMYHGAHANSACLQAIARFGIAKMVPIGGKIPFSSIAEKTGLTEDMTRRLLRFAMTMRIFREPEPGFVAHTKASTVLSDDNMNSWLGAGTEEMWPAAVRMVDALQRWPNASEPNETGFQLANNTNESIYSVISANPARGRRFANSMVVHATNPAFSADHMINSFDWAALGLAQLVDVGGSRGHIAIELAKKFGNLTAVVQDRGEIVAGAEADLPVQLQGRLTFMPHDIFSPQPVKADIFLLRWILHNWSDKYCVLILRALLPALRPGARVLVAETCMPEPGEVALWKEKDHRVFDMTMAAAFNGKERTKKEWEALFLQADPRFVLEGVAEPKGSALALLTVVFDEDRKAADSV